MKKIIFVCHGSICRSPAAEFITKSYLNEIGRDNEFDVSSYALSYEEIGNDIYYPMKEELRKNNISFSYHPSKRLTNDLLKECDYLFYMDDSNKRLLESFDIKNNKDKIKPIYFYSKNINEIEDPWYTDRYNLVVKQIKECVIDIFKNI